jgi:glycosyltransferase involved in cell wall biosynthesis
MLIFDAIYINCGGGRTFLQLLLEVLGKQENILFLLDDRLEFSLFPEKYLTLRNSEFCRKLFYLKNKKSIKRIFCFGNVPPPVRIDGTVATYFHNAHLLSAKSTEKSFRGRMKYWLKRKYIKMRSGNTDYFFVQSGMMRNELCHEYGLQREQVRIMPFFEEGRYADLFAGPKEIGFGYVSLPYPHKRHDLLLDAWEILAAQGLFPELWLTVSNNLFLEQRIKTLCKKGIRIKNLGFCDPKNIYASTLFQIFPSDTESFGLGLIEAAEAGCKVIAPDLPYVHEVISPSLTWVDSGGAVAIAQAVRKALAEELPETRLLAKNKLPEIVDFISNGKI